MNDSRFGRVIFPLFAWGLAFHSLIMAALFGYFGLPDVVVRVIAAWKEVALVLLLFLVMLRSIAGLGPQVPLTWTDFWVGGLLLFGFLYLWGENLWLRANIPVQSELLGFRQSLFFLLAYFVGRGMPQLADDPVVVRRVQVLVVITCLLGVLERFLVPPEGLVALGVAAYFQDFLNATAITVGNEYGLPTNYWMGIGGHMVRRAGSIYLGGQGFALPFLLFFPMALVWAMPRENRSPGRIASLLLIGLGLLLTLTRMTIIVAIIQITLFILIRRRPEWTVAGLAIAGMLFLAALLVVPGVPSFVLQTLSGQEASTAGHLSDFSNGLVAFFGKPWGYGLGTADVAATRSNLEHVTGDNLYLTYAVELGALGVMLLVTVMGCILGHALNLLRNGETRPQREMGTTLWLAGIGLVINGMTSVVFNSIILAWLFFWLAGAVVTQSQRAKRAELSVGQLRLKPA